MGKSEQYKAKKRDSEKKIRKLMKKKEKEEKLKSEEASKVQKSSVSEGVGTTLGVSKVDRIETTMKNLKGRRIQWKMIRMKTKII